jgi:hypothetical protein
VVKIGGEKWVIDQRQRLISLYALRMFLLSVAITIISTSILVYVIHLKLWTSLPVFVATSIALIATHPFWKITIDYTTRYLNQKFPELEESAGLLLGQEKELSGLQRLQREKLTQIIPELEQPQEPLKKVYIALIILLACISVSFILRAVAPLNLKEQPKLNATPTTLIQTPDIVPAEISDYLLSITPPAYTKTATRTQKQFSLRVETGASVSWKITTTAKVKRLNLIMNGNASVPLRNLNGEGKEWQIYKKIVQSGFYQLELDGKKSDLYPIEVIADLPVKIQITNPKQHSTIDFGQPLTTNISVKLTDDYGINDGFISATMASGKGEGVSFTEKKIRFDSGFNGAKEMRLRKQINLKDLGMKPGDELYFFVKATDSYGQPSQSDVYFVSIVDTTELMSMASMSSGVNLVPEYFRSERQIIIDTEKLLRERATLSEATFKSRSNELGIDQKLLRMRYGTFLGEESETEIGEDHEHDEKNDKHDHPAGKEEKFGDVGAIMESYAHKHDVAEDATFFEPALKAQLKAVLTEMWSAELKLRTYKAQEALPFEYKALRLLKDLQQKSRAYVAKTTVKVSQLKPEKRLTGTLDQILESSQQSKFIKKENRDQGYKKLLTLLEQRKSGYTFTKADLQLLNESEKQLISAAAANPTSYLSALKGLRNIRLADKPLQKDLDLVQKALQKIMVKEQTRPYYEAAAPKNNLYQDYFRNLNKAN